MEPLPRQNSLRKHTEFNKCCHEIENKREGRRKKSSILSPTALQRGFSVYSVRILYGPVKVLVLD